MTKKTLSEATMTPREKIKTREKIKRWMHGLEAGYIHVLPPSETLLLLDVAEAALRYIEEKFPCNESDFDPRECSACNLKAAVARLGKG